MDKKKLRYVAPKLTILEGETRHEDKQERMTTHEKTGSPSFHDLVRAYPLSTLLSAGITLLCVMPVPETPLSDVSMIDKWTHWLFYFTLMTVLVFETFKNHPHLSQRPMPALMQCLVLCAALGGGIELIQRYCTFGMRSGEWLDFVADCLGALLALPIGILLARCRARA